MPPLPPPKAADQDILGRFREIISDPLNLLIERVPMAGYVEGGNVILHNGNRVAAVGDAAYYGPFSRILLINRGVHEPLEEFVFQEVLRVMPEAPLMIELGAYWAHYSMWMKRARPRATNIMVEPEDVAIAAGRSNFALNGYEGEFIQAFVGNGHWMLDPFLAERGIDNVDVLHVDIQGHETQMLEGGRDAFGAQRIDYLFVSTHSQAIHTGVVATLQGHGYRVEAASDYDTETTSSDGFVFATSPKVRAVFADFTPPGRVDIATGTPEQLMAALEAARRSIVSR